MYTSQLRCCSRLGPASCYPHTPEFGYLHGHPTLPQLFLPEKAKSVGFFVCFLRQDFLLNLAFMDLARLAGQPALRILSQPCPSNIGIINLPGFKFVLGIGIKSHAC